MLVVSIFLRVLEYYEGILFLTTNRIHHIDDAFHSRIHVALRYPELTNDSRRHIWKTFLSGMASGLSAEDLETLAKRELNGRQIKNVLKTARMLAMRWDEEGEGKGRLRMEHVEKVLRIEEGKGFA